MRPFSRRTSLRMCDLRLYMTSCHTATCRAKEGAEDEHRHLLRIPRRPLWDKFTTTEDLQQREREKYGAAMHASVLTLRQLPRVAPTACIAGGEGAHSADAL
jgi:hypothetical protein